MTMCYTDSVRNCHASCGGCDYGAHGMVPQDCARSFLKVIGVNHGACLGHNPHICNMGDTFLIGGVSQT